MSDENARSLPPLIGEQYPSASGDCERGSGGKESRALLLPFREESSENLSVGVAANGDSDLEGATPRLGCGVFSSSSEEMTYIVQDRVIRGFDIYYMAINPQVCFG